jgi:hypothetical protein
MENLIMSICLVLITYFSDVKLFFSEPGVKYPHLFLPLNLEYLLERGA